MPHGDAKTLKDRLVKARELVPPGSHWTHFKKPDEPYEVVEIGFLEATEEAVVIYKKADAPLVWVRPLEQFLAKIEYQGVSGARFRRVD